MNNCLFWCIGKRIRYGGKCVFTKSRTWIGFHNYWIDRNGNAWEYTLATPKKQPWWYVPLLYKGVVKQIKKP